VRELTVTFRLCIAAVDIQRGRAMKIVSIVLMFAFLLAGCAAVTPGVLPPFYGEPGSENSFDKVVNIPPDAKWVNVKSGETVKFVDLASGRSFVWSFQLRNFAVFDLAAVAPRGVLSHEHLTVYVAQDIRETDDH
jgi:hypothetical protein